jgi:hypothetical protein
MTNELVSVPSVDAAEPAAEAAPAYRPPVVVALGKTRDAIRGYWQQGQADYGYNWYITGE